MNITPPPFTLYGATYVNGKLVCASPTCTAPQCRERQEAQAKQEAKQAKRARSYAENLLAAPLDSVPLDVVRNLADRLDANQRERRCYSQCRGTNCELEKGHDGAHTGIGYDANPPETASPQRARITWEFEDKA